MKHDEAGKKHGNANLGDLVYGELTSEREENRIVVAATSVNVQLSHTWRNVQDPIRHMWTLDSVHVQKRMFLCAGLTVGSR